MQKIEYRKEFFDRDYSAWNAYKRVWKYARKYKFRLLIGIIAGMLTAGTLVPLFQIVQPALRHAESHDRSVVVTGDIGATADISQTKGNEGGRNAYEKEILRNSKLPAWYPTVEK